MKMSNTLQSRDNSAMNPFRQRLDIISPVHTSVRISKKWTFKFWGDFFLYNHNAIITHSNSWGHLIPSLCINLLNCLKFLFEVGLF